MYSAPTRLAKRKFSLGSTVHPFVADRAIVLFFRHTTVGLVRAARRYGLLGRASVGFAYVRVRQIVWSKRSIRKNVLQFTR